MLKSVKVRLYLNKEQQTNIDKLLGCCRFVYNNALEYKIKAYENENKNTSLTDTSHLFHDKLRNDFEWLKEHNTKVIKQSLINLETAYKNFFKSKFGFPKFKRKSDIQTCRFPIDAISKDAFKNNKLNLTKTIKDLKFECSDRDRNYLIKNREGIRSITLTKTKTNKYFVSILIDGDLQRVMPKTNNVIALDLGIKTLVSFSDGTIVDNPKWIRNNEKELKKLQKQLSRKEGGSNNREKIRFKLTIKHEKIKNRKQDFLHNLTSKIIYENQIIILEDLNVKGMIKNHKLAKSISELGLGELRRQLEYKAKWYGRDIVFVDRFYASSKICSCCGWKNQDLKLSDRTFECKECGIVLDRDLNASINIKNEGIRLYKESNREALARI